MKAMEHGTYEVTQLLAEAKETEENGNEDHCLYEKQLQEL